MEYLRYMHLARALEVALETNMGDIFSKCWRPIPCYLSISDHQEESGNACIFYEGTWYIWLFKYICFFIKFYKLFHFLFIYIIIFINILRNNDWDDA